MATIEIPAQYASVPHDLIFEPRLSGDEVRLYAVLFRLGWQRQAIDGVSTLAEVWPSRRKPPTERTFYRWLAALRETGWIDYQPHPGQRGIGDRLKLNAEPRTSDPNVRGCPEPLILGSEVSPTSDSRVRASDPNVRASDIRIRGTPDLPRPNAPKNALLNSEDLTQNPDAAKITATAAPGGGGGCADALPEPPPERPQPTLEEQHESRQLLKAEGVRSSQALRRLVQAPPKVIKRCAAEARKAAGVRESAGLLVGYVDAWLETGELPGPPPAPVQPQVFPLPAPEDRRRLTAEERATLLRMYEEARDRPATPAPS